MGYKTSSLIFDVGCKSLIILKLLPNKEIYKSIRKSRGFYPLIMLSFLLKIYKKRNRILKKERVEDNNNKCLTK